MFDEITVIGAGRAGTTIAARLRERGLPGRERGAAPPLRPRPCDPRGCPVDRAGPVGRTRLRRDTARGARPARAAVLGHPLQTLSKEGGPQQLDGAWGGVTAESEEARSRGLWLAETLGLHPFMLADDRRALYHAGASIASNFLVTLYRVAADLVERAGAPPEALVPLMERTIANGFQLTGPIARGDWSTVERHREVLHDTGYAELYDALAEATHP